MSVPSITIRNLSEADFTRADEIIQSAFHITENRIRDLRLYHRIQPDGIFGALKEDVLIATGGAICYHNIAYIGLVAVHPQVQRQGFGQAIVQHVLAWLEQQQIPVWLLDSSADGYPLYMKLGFVTYDQALTYQAPEDHQAYSQTQEDSGDQARLKAEDLDELIRFDAAVFGARRENLLCALYQDYAERAFVLRDEQARIKAYLFAQAKRIGPWMAQDPLDAQALFQLAMNLSYERTPLVYIPQANHTGQALLERYGCKLQSQAHHMGKGRPTSPAQRTQIYGQMSLAYG